MYEWRDNLFKVINEAPLADFGIHGDTENAGSYAASDVKVFHNQKWLEKVKTHFQKTPYDVNVYLYNAPNGEYFPYDDYDGNPRDQQYPENSIRRKFDGLLDNSQIAQLQRMLDIKIPQSSGAITFVMLDNEGDEKVGLTPWILVHRFVHGMLSADSYTSNRVMKSGLALKRRLSTYGRLSDIFKFKSAQHGKIAREGEYAVEMFTQYVVQGSLTINMPSPPKDPFAGDIAFLRGSGVNTSSKQFKLLLSYAKRGSYSDNYDEFISDMLGDKPEEGSKKYQKYIKAESTLSSYYNAYNYAIHNVLDVYENQTSEWKTIPDSIEFFNEYCDALMKDSLGKVFVISGK